MFGQLRAVYDPARFQGARRHDRYFEGWYFKCVDAAASHAIAVIPGISRDAVGGTSHSFVQVIRPGGRTYYAEYPLDAFTWRSDRFEIAVGSNRFTRDGISLDLTVLPAEGSRPDRAERGELSRLRVHGELTFGTLHSWPVTLLSPGVMGWYRFVPRMECYHGVVSMDHSLEGSLVIDDTRLSFDGGRGYAEKDWGTSFPTSWAWVQSNHFARSGVSLMASVARVPWRGSHFIGHVAGLLLEGDLMRFATYTGARLCHCEIREDGASIVLRDRRSELSLDVEGALAGTLKAPVDGRMIGRADESLDSQVHVALRELRGGRARLCFQGTGQHAGVELMNVRGELVAEHC